MAIKSEEILATGRRKCAVARVRLQPGTGKIEVNGKALEEYFPEIFPGHEAGGARRTDTPAG